MVMDHKVDFAIIHCHLLSRNRRAFKHFSSPPSVSEFSDNEAPSTLVQTHCENIRKPMDGSVRMNHASSLSRSLPVERATDGNRVTAGEMARRTVWLNKRVSEGGILQIGNC